MAVTTLQVTISGKTQISSTSIKARWITFQNNDSSDMHVGDTNVSSTRGIKLTAGGSNFTPPVGDPALVHDLSQWFLAGTDTQKLDVVYDKVGS